MDKLDEGLKDTKIRRDTQVRGSLGLSPSGASDDESRDRDDAIPEFDRERAKGQSDAEDDRMSER